MKKIPKAQIIFIVFFLLVLVLAFSGYKREAKEKEEEIITYEKISASDLLEVLNDNPLKAKETYNNKYLEVTGTLGTIDADGEYITIKTGKGGFIGVVHCSITNGTQRNYVSTLSKNDPITARVHITDVGGLIRYNAVIIEFVE